jgi:glucose-6-phosphate-specific signal transduction histidine kinase
VPLLVGFCFNVPKEGIVLAQRRRRFELRISDEDRDRLRTLAEQQAQTESDAIRALIREAHDRVGDDSKSGEEERTAA